MSYDIHILVNGNRCKQYHHDGKIFIEAKEGSEYAIEIKNNEWKRILAVCSVDGLNILNGKTATEDGPGYVLGCFNSTKLEGFRVSDEKVSKFVFGEKGSSYAASKEDGSEKNVGVIGVRIFAEKEKPAPIVIREDHHHHHYPKPLPTFPDPWDTYPGTPWRPYPMWCDSTWTSSGLGDITYGCTTSDMAADEPKPRSANMMRSLAGNSPKVTGQFLASSQQLSNAGTDALRGFDMGTKWGEAKESKVVEVEFERGLLVLTTNIYYASRQSLIEMGVPIGNEKQVSFPEPFADSKYAKPPKGWRG